MYKRVMLMLIFVAAFGDHGLIWSSASWFRLIVIIIGPNMAIVIIYLTL